MMNDQLRKVITWLILEDKVSSNREMAQQMGYNPSAFSQIVNGRVPMSEKFLSRLAAYEPKINIDWVRTGQGSMLNSDGVAEALKKMDGEEELEFFTENSHGVKFYKNGDHIVMVVRHVPYAAFGQFANDSDRLDPVEDDWTWEPYEVDRLARGNYLSFEVQGSSMDTGQRTSFEPGDKVLVREVERVYWRQGLRYEQWPYYVIVFGSSVLLKQISYQDKATGVITCHSLNPSPEFQDFTLSMDEVRGLYRVIKKKPKEIRFGSSVLLL